jgi:hypothetical protein
MTSSDQPQAQSDNSGNERAADLAARAAAAARAELRGEREGILGAVGPTTLTPLARARTVPDCWSLVYVMDRLEEAFRTLSRLPLPTRPKGYINSMPIYLYDRGDLNSQLETHELERMARLKNRVRLPPSPAEIARMEEALHWPSAYLSAAEFHHVARAVNLGSLWSAFDVDIDKALKRVKIKHRADALFGEKLCCGSKTRTGFDGDDIAALGREDGADGHF